MKNSYSAKQLIFLFSIIVPLSFSSCKDKGEAHVPNISGSAGEMLIVMDDSVRANVGGKRLESIMRQSVVGLPQAEPLFDVSVIPHRAFSQNLRSFRNLIVVKLDDEHDPEIKYYKGQWGKEQAMAHIFARNSWQLDSLVDAQELRLTGFFVRAERERSRNYYRKYMNENLTEKFQERWNAFMIVPITFEENESGTDFMWMSHETPLISQGVFVYSFDYTGPQSISKSYLINKRDSVLRVNVPGPSPGSYMTTESRLPVSYKRFENNEHQIAELRGLWKVEGDLMGGPFVSFSHIDEVNNRVVVTDAYVYAPEKPEKRNLIWQLESILYSFRFLDNNKDNAQ